METFHLDQLQYSDEIKGSLRLYIYLPSGYHTGGQWFREKPKYPDEEITVNHAHLKADGAIKTGQEVRITNGGDLLVFHAKYGKVLYPHNPEKFWKECGK